MATLNQKDSVSICHLSKDLRTRKNWANIIPCIEEVCLNIRKLEGPWQGYPRHRTTMYFSLCLKINKSSYWWFLSFFFILIVYAVTVFPTFSPFHLHPALAPPQAILTGSLTNPFTFFHPVPSSLSLQQLSVLPCIY